MLCSGFWWFLFLKTQFWGRQVCKSHLQPWPVSTVPARVYGDIRSDWGWIGHILRKDSNPSPKLQSTRPQRENGSVVDWRQPGKELWKRKWRTWPTAGAPSRGWPVTDRGGGASLLLYAPAGVTGSDDDDDDDDDDDTIASVSKLQQQESFPIRRDGRLSILQMW